MPKASEQGGNSLLAGNPERSLSQGRHLQTYDGICQRGKSSFSLLDLQAAGLSQAGNTSVLGSKHERGAGSADQDPLAGAPSSAADSVQSQVTSLTCILAYQACGRQNNPTTSLSHRGTGRWITTIVLWAGAEVPCQAAVGLPGIRGPGLNS